MRERLLRARGPRRTLALSTALGVLLLGGPTAPAVADSSYEPPELTPTTVPGGPLTPQPGDFQQQEGCLQGTRGGQTIEEKPWSQRFLGFEQAHEQGLTGRGQTIAVIDTGVNPHPRLAVDGSGGSAVPRGGANDDCDGHGTAVAGIIAAHPDPQTGFVGVAPDSTILSIRQSSQKFVNQGNDQTVGNTATMAQAVQHAAEAGASVINISQSSCQAIAEATDPSSAQYGFNNQLHQAVKNAHDRGAVVVAAAGNTTDQCQKNPSGAPTTAVLPAWFDDYVLTVGSVNQQGAPSEFTVPGPWVDVAAPGENLTTLDPGVGGVGLANQLQSSQGQPEPIMGTSFAAPYVSGLVALIKQEHPELGPGQIMERIEKTALHPGGTDGRNDIVGAGVIDPMAALNDVVPAEHGVSTNTSQPARLDADVLPPRDWPALLTALGGTGAGIAAILFTAFLINARRNLRSRLNAQRTNAQE
ncbi:hypothetical protein GCM10027174_20860 [Salinifilum aidingensis]